MRMQKIKGVSHIATLCKNKHICSTMGFTNYCDDQESIDIVTSTIEGIKGKEVSNLEAMELLMKQSNKKTEVEKFVESYNLIVKAREKCLNESERYD